MADKWLVASGDVGTAANWNGGTLPLMGDDCYADGFTGTITSDLTVASLRTTQRSGGTAGGGFTCGTAGVTITASIYAGSSVCLSVTNTTGTVTVSGNITASGDTVVAHGLSKTGVGSLSIIGVITGGNVNAQGVMIGGACSYSITGNIIGGGNNSGSGLYLSSSGSTGTIVGDIIADVSYGLRFANNSCSATVTGNVYASGTVTSILIVGANTLVVNGDVYGCSGTGTQPGINSTQSSTITINGNCIGGTSSQSGNAAHGITNGGTGSVTVNGYVIGAPSGGASAGIYSVFGATATVREIRTSATGVQGAYGKVFISDFSSGKFYATKSDGSTQEFRNIPPSISVSCV
jgi:hypothetical protein